VRFTLYSCFNGRSSPHPRKNGPTTFFPRFPARVCPSCNWGICPRGIFSLDRRKLPFENTPQGCVTAFPRIVRLCDIFFWEMLHARTEFLRFELSHKFGGNFFQNSADSIDKERRRAYVLDHRMRTACVFNPGPPDASIFKASSPTKGSVHVRYELHRLRVCGVLLS
jgi:hypothetical protein